MSDDKENNEHRTAFLIPESWRLSDCSYPSMAINQNPQPLKISFLREDKVLGSLVENEDGKLTFSGDMEASAAVFFDFCCNTWPNMADMRRDANKYQAILPLITAIVEASSHSEESQHVSKLIEHMEANNDRNVAASHCTDKVDA